MKSIFLENELWGLVILGAFQRADCYKKDSEVLQIRKRDFKRDLRLHIDTTILPQYKGEVSEDKHIENIIDLIEFSKRYADIFSRESLNFGISQKLLNLYLKYHWVAGNIERPPHFPVDRIIQEKLGIKNIQPWTQFSLTDGKYDYVIAYAKQVLKDKHIPKTELHESAFDSLADLELHLFNRR
ncbi:hypothetical protein BCY89_26650 [Sphingobacterium siyangense]|uniref:Uncharacterized protein n=1 Tax=Sphingobacterium siyangense TaxID=459529 RepID=A0A420G142_9SPHI|nr:hypothetical protein [Sphingobacterium siyangense]QRY60522.1 hypothetical protein JVX97_14160 [Sphingobacterium siyangense]RKF38929.1 hypothetical protein BCY89_26650 [Sphingobacterium siyangense]